jgi:hypothetical protein
MNLLRCVALKLAYLTRFVRSYPQLLYSLLSSYYLYIDSIFDGTVVSHQTELVKPLGPLQIRGVSSKKVGGK